MEINMNIQQNMSLMEKLSILPPLQNTMLPVLPAVWTAVAMAPHGELSRLRNLSLILCGWALYFSAQDPLYQ